MMKATVLTSSLISSTIVALGLYLAPAQETATHDAGVTQHRHHVADDANDATVDSVITMLDNSRNNQVEELLAKYRELGSRNYLLEQRISELEQGASKGRMAAADNTESVNDSGMTANYQPSAEEVQYEEDMLALQESDNRFDTLVAQMANESHDANWQTEMEESLIAAQQRLESFNLPKANISRMQCGDQSCLVEFTTDAADVDLHIYAGLLAAQGAGEVVLKHGNEGDGNRILAIYRR